jgi:hypothetical protein
MAMLDGFRDKDFLEQVTILNEIAASKDISNLPGLMDLFRRPVGDTSIDFMVVNALTAVLSGNEAKTVEGLASGNAGYRTLCIRVIGEYGFSSAGPMLTSLGENETDPDQLQEILSALSRIEAPDALPLFRNHSRGGRLAGRVGADEKIGIVFGRQFGVKFLHAVFVRLVVVELGVKLDD